MATNRFDAITIIANRKPFTCEILRTGLFRTKTKIYYNDEFFGDVNDKELGLDITVLLNAATMLGSSSGYSHARNQEDLSKINLNDHNYKPYTLNANNDNQNVAGYSISFEDSPVRNYVHISRQALNSTVRSLNQAYHIGYKDGVKLAQLEKKHAVEKVNNLDEMSNSPSASM